MRERQRLTFPLTSGMVGLLPFEGELRMKKGIYLTTYGNAAYVSGPKAKTAFDLDMDERIPLSEVNPHKWIREADDDDIRQARNRVYGCASW